MERDQASKFMFDLLRLMVSKKGSDLFITAGFPPAIKIDGKMTPVSAQVLTAAHTTDLARSIMNDKQTAGFELTKEANFAISPGDLGRFRVSAFVQMSSVGMVLRTITSEIPKLEDLGLPEVLKDIVMAKRGLVIMVGATGSGKSTTLAAMVGYRNENSYGHIITIEDPVEYVHPHKNCIVTQREVGVDTDDWAVALKNTLRQAPDVIQIGEIRDRETMDHAIAFAETGHLCLATLHANSANQAIDRIINFFPEERRQQLLMDLSLNLKGMVSQRLVPLKESKGRAVAIEILLNSPLISDLIFKGQVHEIKELMKKSRELGMQTFDQSLFDLHEADKITYEDALRNADSVNDLRLAIKLEGKGLENRDLSLGTEHLGLGVMANIYELSVDSLAGAPVDLAQYRGQVLLIVNTASQCGFTPQYKGLEAVYQQFKDRGVVVLGFPCNQFGGQEPGQAAEIGAFCEKNYGVTFPLFAKVDVNGSDAHPLFRELKKAAPGILGTQAIKWNFTKFLVGKDGRIEKRYAPATKPEQLIADIEALL